MMKAPLYIASGEKKGEVTLQKEIFGAAQRAALLHEATVRHLNNARVDTAYAKTRAEVRGGGRKPYRQKGTGRARQGSIRSPHYRGGGVAFGPRGNRNYEMVMPKKQRRAAIFSALSVKAKAGEIFVLDSFSAKKPSTKAFAELLEKITDKRRVLLVLDQPNMILEKSAGNLPQISLLQAQYLNVVDVLWADVVIFLEPALKKIEELFLSA